MRRFPPDCVPEKQDQESAFSDALRRAEVPAGNGQQIYTAVVNWLNAASITWQGRPPAFSGASAAGGIKAPAATSSTDETPSPGLAGNPAARRASVGD